MPLQIVHVSAPPPSILVNADSRDIRLYEGLIRRGYRLIGFPSRQAGVVASQGVAIRPMDFLQTAATPAFRRTQVAFEAMLPPIHELVNSAAFGQFVSRGNGAPVHEVRQALLEAVERVMPAGTFAVEAFEELAEQENVSLVLVRDDNPHPAKAIILAARAHGIPSLSVNHGMPWAQTIDSTVHADTVAVYGPWTRDWYVRNGNDLGRIAITGNPAWDGYAESATLVDLETIRQSLGLDPHVPVVFLATIVHGLNRAADFIYWDWPWQHYLATIRSVARIASTAPLQLVIKFHPAVTSPADIARHVRAAQAHGIQPVTLSGWADPRHLCIADVVVCTDSTIAVEAMLLDRPVVNLRLGETFPTYLYDDSDAVINVIDESALADALPAALFDPSTQAALAGRRASSLYRFNYINDSRATDRVLGLIDLLLDRSTASASPAHNSLVPLRTQLTPDQRERVARQHLDQAQAELEAGRHHAARLLAEQALPFMSNQAPAHFLAGFADYSTGSPSSALREFERAIGDDGSNPTYHNAAAGALHELGRLDEAEAAVRRALALDPDYLDARLNMVEILMAIGRSDAAHAALVGLEQDAPGHPQVIELRRRLDTSA